MKRTPLVLIVALAVPALGAPAPAEDEALVTLDARKSDAKSVLEALARLGQLQVVFDPDLSCELSVKVQRVRWATVLDAVLGACGFGAEWEAPILRVAPRRRLAEEADSRRRLAEAKAAILPRSMTRFRLSYARAQELAPLLERMLTPGSKVVYDQRSNTLLLITGGR